MESASVLPTPVAAEISGAGSFFGSCQLDSGNFAAALEQAVAQRQGEGDGSLLTVALQGEQPAGRVQALLESLLGEEGAAAYAQLTEILDQGALAESSEDG